MDSTPNPPGSAVPLSRADARALEDARRIALEIARPAAAEVDRHARFPLETFAALRAAGLVSALVPEHLGGLGCSIPGITQMCTVLAQACGATGLIFAMHQIQVACLVRHASSSEFLRGLLRDIARDSALIASATSEVGTHGDVRSSIAAIESSGDSRSLTKACPAISYGAQADAILVTARKDTAAAAADQVLVLLCKSDYRIEQMGPWDTLGMRGTCSPPFRLRATFGPEHILPAPFRDIAAQTMVPYSHLFWAAVWLGIASDAVTISRELYRATARRSAAAAALMGDGLAAAVAKLDGLRALVSSAMAGCESIDSPALVPCSVPGSSVKANNLKIEASSAVCQICLECLRACGLRGYTDHAPGGLGRHIRDALSAPIMISNDRLIAINRTLLQIDSGNA